MPSMAVTIILQIYFRIENLQNTPQKQNSGDILTSKNIEIFPTKYLVFVADTH